MGLFLFWNFLRMCEISRAARQKEASFAWEIF
jgi:hypothetical protein